MSEHYEKVIGFLRVEADAIERAAANLDARQIDSAVQAILEAEGKIVVTGVGKSGVIAQKIAQTMTSTGTVALFLHPSDALHGSLGVVSQGDVLIALSNSGETDELLAILPSLKQRCSSLIAIVGNRDSTLAKHANFFLDASVDKEACPLNLAPTTSTTVALAIGDAIAMAVMAAKNLTAEGFAANHPAGRLGKRLTTRVSDLMHESVSVAPEANWLEVVKMLTKYALGAVNVVDIDSNLRGIVTDGDLRRMIEKSAGSGLDGLTAEQLMTVSPVVTRPEMLAYDALRLMEDRPRQISVLPVIDAEDKCVGLLRLHDIVKSGL